jgi:hypothetical protein
MTTVTRTPSLSTRAGTSSCNQCDTRCGSAETITSSNRSTPIASLTARTGSLLPIRPLTGNVVPQHTMKLTIGSDHPIVNGAENALYLAELKRLLQRPILLTV